MKQLLPDMLLRRLNFRSARSEESRSLVKTQKAQAGQQGNGFLRVLGALSVRRCNVIFIYPYLKVKKHKRVKKRLRLAELTHLNFAGS